MSEKKRTVIFTTVNLILINWAVMAFLNLSYPFVGHDYSLGIPGILDSALHFRLNGLSIHWFTPSFGGGIPPFPNLNNGQLIGFLLHFAGYFILIIFGLSIFIIVPVIYILNPALIDPKKLSAKFLLGGLIGLLISLSKLAAVYSFMRFFPRAISDNYSTLLLLGIFALFLQLLGTMNLVPLFLIARLNPDAVRSTIIAVTDVNYGFWEMDTTI